MKNKKSITITFLLLAVVIPFTLSCKRIYDDLTGCPTGIVLLLSSKNPCGEVVPLDEMQAVRISIHDPSGKMVAQYDDLPIAEHLERTVSIPFDKKGEYSITVWGMGNLEAYKAIGKGAIQLSGELKPYQNPHLSPLFYGSINHYSRTNDFHTDTLQVNVLPYRYQVNVQIKGPKITSGGSYSLQIEDVNAAYDYLGNILRTPITYKNAFVETPALSGIYKTSLQTLKLSRDGETRLNIIHSDGTVIDSWTLDEMIKNIEKVHGRVINLECENELDINIEYQNTGSYLAINLTINDWNVVIRKEILT